MSLETRVGSDPYQSYVPRLLFEWQRDYNDETFREIAGTMVFADISGFTALSEMLSQFGKLGAEEVTDVIGDCFQALLDVVYPLGGRLLKFGGDALLLLFTGSDHARRAVNAAVGMLKEMGRVGKVKTSGGRITLRMSIGIHSGSFDFYLVGDSHRELIITGSAATTTAEMETAASAGEIAVSPATASQLPPDIVGPMKGDAYLIVGSTSDDFDTDVDVRPARSDLEEFVPVAIRELILADAIEAEHRLVTIAFIQFLEVEKMRDDRGMEGVARALNNLVTDVQSAIDPRQITFVSTDIYDDGGKIILAAGAPTSTGNDEERMLDALRQIASKERDLPIRIGVNRGHVFAGDVGPDYRHSYTVMGDGVNLAARLMSAADIGEIRSTPTVLDHSRTMYATTALEPFMVKGKAEPVHACSVGEEIGTRIDIDEHRLPFTGRDRELEVLQNALNLARDGQGSNLTVSGDRGIGKTRLVEEAVRGFQPIIEIRAEPYGAANPYRALRDPVRELLGIERSDHGSMATTLAEAIERVDPSLLPLMPLVADIVQIEVPSTSEVDDIEPRFRPERAADVLVTIIEDLIPGPLAFVVDDGHYADEASAKLLARLCAETGARPWIVLTTRRDVEGGFEPPGEPMTLHPLDSATARSIIIDVTEDAPLRPHELEAIIERTSGNPLYIGEVLAAVKTAGSFSDLPDSLDALVTTQIDALLPGSRQLLRYASVLGRSFRPELLRRILNESADEVNKLIHTDLSAFLELEDDRVRFRHSIHRDAAYDGLSFRRRRELHLSAGRAIEDLAPDPDSVAEALGMHFFLGHAFDEAWNYSRIAGDDARDAYGNVEAAANYERALAASKKLKDLEKRELAAVWIALGDVREQIARFPEANDAYQQAGKLLAGDPVAQADTIAKRGKAKMRGGSYTSALADTTRGLKLLECMEGAEIQRARARLMTTRAWIRMSQQRPRQALEASNNAIRVAQMVNE
ncbi:MAG: AAA family ATPase, partial [Acidimicrobiia bacterium]|nr:AAA family ATPase [Acidimicrobiia bacterium]